MIFSNIQPHQFLKTTTPVAKRGNTMVSYNSEYILPESEAKRGYYLIDLDREHKTRLHRTLFKCRELATFSLLHQEKRIEDTPFKFKQTSDASLSNWDIIYKNNFSLSNIKDNTILNPQFEFNRLDYLDMVMHDYPS